ncbi:hypothetical protein [Rhizobium leguminosarum]|uniref:hypothetical protein n=1 Tax=Rhizobium leguminosarum TaxID=384 RepID=UPI00140FD554|nr:hypothetical protein [Rhizobium leguminosarum]QIO64794.1 hypothetical protein HA462_06940 [Rhizobium leguminosarum bv. trifolii]
MKSKLSPAQRRKAAIQRSFPRWYLTNGMTSAAAHITAAFRSIAELSTIRAYLARGRISDKERKLYTQSAVQAARFNLSIGRDSSPLP